MTIPEQFKSDEAHGDLTRSSHAHPDDVSHLSDLSTTSRASTISRLSHGIASVLSQSLCILKGESPCAIEEENDESGEIPRHVNSPLDNPHERTLPECDNPKSQAMKNELNTRTDGTGGRGTIDFLKDPVSEMTWGRRIALFCMKRYAWYNPRLNPQHEEQAAELPVSDNHHPRETFHSYPFDISRRENPSLEKAWAYFEHVALSRYVVPPDEQDKTKKNLLKRIFRRIFCKGGQQLRPAEPGEKDYPTRLYKPLFTPHAQLGDFGLGLGMYFSTLRAITVMTFIAGLLNLPNMLYFASSDYNVANSQKDNVNSWFVQGSAICVDTSWVPCPNCNGTDLPDSRLLQATNGIEQMTFALKNNCDGATYQVAFINLATLMLIIVGTIALNMYLQRMEVIYDEDEQTAQDYSIVVQNPPGDATSPKEWFKFFHDNFDGAHMTACTIAVDNDLLVRSLVERREILRKIEMMVEPGTSLDTLTLARIAAKEERKRRTLARWKAMFIKGIPELFGRVVVLNALEQGLAQQEYPATKVFCTFETEESQRHVLAALSYGEWHVSRQNKAAAKDPRHLFRGEHLLSVSEADEPNTIRWQDLNEKRKTMLKQQSLTIFATLCAILAIAFVIRITNDTSVVFAAIAISVFNSAFPVFAKLLTNLEAHGSEGVKQRSLYFKIALFRWVNTAIVITIITPFTGSLASGGLIDQIYALFFAEIVTTNAIQLADPIGHLQRHFFAPRAATQDAMNINMQGQVFELAERYTNMTKILFLALWYSAIYPAALFLCSFSLLVNYFTDRFSLMRTWKRSPHLGTKISQFSRRYFFSLAIVAMALLSSYYWSAFPFDNLCVDKTSINNTYAGEWTLIQSDGMPGTAESVRFDDPIYEYCLQDFFRYPKEDLPFPFISSMQPEGKEWMTEEQELISDIFGWTSVGVLGVIFLSFVWGWVKAIAHYFHGSYVPVGESQNIPFSEVASISSYIPQVESSVFSYPLLACNVDGIDHKLLEWTDPDRPDYKFYDLTKDAEALLKGTVISSKVVFSHVGHFPPEINKSG